MSKQPISIVFLSFYSGYIHRGMETVVHELASRLSLKHQITVIQSGPKPQQSQPYTTIQIPIAMRWPQTNDRGLTRKLFLDYYSRQIARFGFKTLPHLSRINPDIIVSTSGGWSTLISKYFCLKSHAKLVISGQAGLGWDDRFNLLCQPDLFIALSTRNLAWAHRYARNLNMQIIPNGVDLNRFQVKSHSPASALPDPIKTAVSRLPKPHILCVAGNQPYKRVADTIHAVAQLPQGSLILCRGGEIDPHDPDIKLGKQLLDNRFYALALNHDQMPALYQLADLFTLVSESTEAFGIAYLEALASGLPVVATDDTLRREIIGPAGLYVKDPGNHPQYAKQLTQALQSAWHNKPRQQAQRFGWDQIAKDYEKAFNQLLAS